VTEELFAQHLESPSRTGRGRVPEPARSTLPAEPATSADTQNSIATILTGQSALVDQGAATPLTADQRDVLRLCLIPRRTGDVAFLHREGGGDPGVAEAALADLDHVGMIELGPDDLWRQTDEGRAALHQSDDWEVVVQEVFSVSGRPRPLVVCVVRRGVIYVGDWFRRNGADVGIIVSVEFPPRRSPPDPANGVTLTLDIDVAQGDVLTAFEPVAA
jgi:hypothetical protein